MCLHEGDKVFNPLHAERFRSLFSKSYFSFQRDIAFFLADDDGDDATATVYRGIIAMAHNLIASFWMIVFHGTELQ